MPMRQRAITRTVRGVDTRVYDLRKGKIRRQSIRNEWRNICDRALMCGRTKVEHGLRRARGVGLVANNTSVSILRMEVGG